MQVLKEEIRSSIRSAALTEFSLHGYSGASMRLIAKRACISPGNLYHYYPSKDELFYELLTPSVHKIVSCIEEGGHERTGVHEFQCFMNNQAHIISKVISENKTEIMILLTGSKGTKFENSKQIFVESLYRHIREHITAKELLIPEEIAWVQAKAIVEGYLELFMKCSDREDFAELLELYFTLTFRGWGEFFSVSSQA